MARLNPFSLYPPSLEEALRDVLAVGSPRSRPTPANAHQTRHPTMGKASRPTRRKASTAKAKKKHKK